MNSVATGPDERGFNEICSYSYADYLNMIIFLEQVSTSHLSMLND